MASSLQTLIKILRLEQQKGYQNKAVIGGFARFAYHWAREAHGQAKTDSHHTLVDEITSRLRTYETLDESQRTAEIETIIALASGQTQVAAPQQAGNIEPTIPTEPPAAVKPEHPTRDQAEAELPDEEPLTETKAPGPSTGTRPREPVTAPRSVRERRGYAWQEPAPVDPALNSQLEQPLSQLRGIGDKRAAQLAKLELHKARDLLFHFPRRYDDYSKMKIIQQLQIGEEVTVIGMFAHIQTVRTKQDMTRVEAYLEDESGTLRLNWFNQPWIADKLKEGDMVVVSGKIEQYLGRLVMNSPELEPLESEWLQAGRIVPVYPLSKGITNKTLRRLIKKAVDAWAVKLPDYLPVSIRENADLMDYGDAISQAHFPDNQEDKEAALHRLAFDDLFTLHLNMLKQRYLWQSRQGTPLVADDEWVSAFLQSLPYQLTAAQQNAIEDIRHDIAGDVPMNRLLQGDVGSGKTAVAALAMGIAVANNTQAVMMTPTSILAQQHYDNLHEIFDNSPLRDHIIIDLLTGHTPQSEREAIYAGLAHGSIHVIVGTHALIQPDVHFAHLGLAVIDEQHRFGVAQRGALRDKAADANPHLLVMTATPIPRTLALTLHADLDLTIIDEMPPGRVPVQTRILQPKERERAYSFIRGQVEKGHQAFIIYPLVEESDKLSARAATAEHERLQKMAFPDLRLGLLHGRMRTDDKDAVMTAFYRGDIDILVSTSVIEVGIDVPNATVMLIENANRFGLAQLHQLRGRVGRGGHESYCLLMSDNAFFETDERLKAMEETTDGFRLAQIDWEMRGAGDLLGYRQSGFGDIHFANLMDARLVEQVQREARAIYEHDPELQRPEHQALAKRVSCLGQQGDIS
ncbi:MAG: ATP-dependent DNA helicase RecG [Anaerolineae bacterium]|nr:ATP-dependent DNA helicase RecG [Anaerolineae bacterium]